MACTLSNTTVTRLTFINRAYVISVNRAARVFSQSFANKNGSLVRGTMLAMCAKQRGTLHIYYPRMQR